MNARLAEILSLTLEHLWLVLIAIGVAALVAIPGAVALTRRAGLRSGMLGLASVLQTIPSLALFGFLLPLPFIGGIGRHTAIIALCLYALLPILRNTLVGILGVDPADGWERAKNSDGVRELYINLYNSIIQRARDSRTAEKQS